MNNVPFVDRYITTHTFTPLSYAFIKLSKFYMEFNVVKQG